VLPTLLLSDKRFLPGFMHDRKSTGDLMIEISHLLKRQTMWPIKATEGLICSYRIYSSHISIVSSDKRRLSLERIASLQPHSLLTDLTPLEYESYCFLCGR